MKHLKVSAVTIMLSTLLWLGCGDRTPLLAPDGPSASSAGPNVVQVSQPTGNPADDRASIEAALNAVASGGIIQFASGVYEIGLTVPFSAIEVTIPGITLVGHPDGTTLRGCDPADIAPVLCEGLLLTGGHQTVRRIDFVDMASAIIMEPAGDASGGYRIEYNTFRNSMEGIILFGQLAQPAVVRNNTFSNVGAAVLFLGSTIHVLDNQILASEPALIPIFGEGFLGVLGLVFDLAGTGPCDHNIIARNRIAGYRWGAGVEVIAGESCSHNQIRDNLIVDSRIFAGFDLGAPLFVWNESDQEELMKHNLVQGNRVVGAEGAGVVILRASHTRIVNNAFEQVGSSPVAEWLGAGNGSGVWISPGSSDNQINGNSFSGVETYAVVLEGDRNHVATTSRDHSVLDLGADNRVTGPGSLASLAWANAVHGAGADAAASLSRVAESVPMQSLENARRELIPLRFRVDRRQ
jgi:hypothetical protein